MASLRVTTAALGAAAALSLLAAPAVADESPSPGAGPGSADGTAEVVALTQPGVVYEEITFSARALSAYNEEALREEPFSVTYVCSGFVVHPDGWIGTAGHCVNEDDEVTADVRAAAVDWALANYYADEVTEEDATADILVSTDVRRKVAVTLPAAVTGSEAREDLPARVIDSSDFDQGDAALLKVEAKDLNGLPLAAEDPAIGDPITSVGYPAIIESYTDHDLTPTFQPGTISSSKTVGDGLLPVYQLSQDLQGGMSGGPTVDAEGRVVGVISSGFDTTDLSYASPIDRLGELLAAAGVEPMLSEPAQAFREGVAAVHAGERSTAIRALQEVVDAQPRNEAAADYLDRAEALAQEPAARPDRDDSRTWLAAAIAAGTILLAGLVIAVALIAARRQERRERRQREREVAAWAALQAQPPAYGHQGHSRAHGQPPAWR